MKYFKLSYTVVWLFSAVLMLSAQNITQNEKKPWEVRPKKKATVSPSVRRIYQEYHKSFEMMQVDRPWVFDNGILFTYDGDEMGTIKRNRRSLPVYLSGSFFNWLKKVKLTKNQYGVYQVFVASPLNKGKYHYRFWINGVWINDEEQPLWEFNEKGERLGYFVLNEEILPIVTESPKKIDELNYRFFLKDKGYREVYWVSSLTGWDPYSYKMKLERGYWVTDQMVNQEGLYFFMVDGVKVLDPLNLPAYYNKFGFKGNFVGNK